MSLGQVLILYFQLIQKSKGNTGLAAPIPFAHKRTPTPAHSSSTLYIDSQNDTLHRQEMSNRFFSMVIIKCGVRPDNCHSLKRMCSEIFCLNLGAGLSLVSVIVFVLVSDSSPTLAYRSVVVDPNWVSRQTGKQGFKVLLTSQIRFQLTHLNGRRNSRGFSGFW